MGARYSGVPSVCQQGEVPYEVQQLVAAGLVGEAQGGVQPAALLAAHQRVVQGAALYEPCRLELGDLACTKHRAKSKNQYRKL